MKFDWETDDIFERLFEHCNGNHNAERGESRETACRRQPWNDLKDTDDKKVEVGQPAKLFKKIEEEEVPCGVLRRRYIVRHIRPLLCV